MATLRCVANSAVCRVRNATNGRERSGRRLATKVSANEPTTPSPLRPDESSEEAAKRRQRESERVEERLSDVSTLDEMKQELHNAGERLVVIDIESQDECEVFDGVDRDGSKNRRMEMCVQLKHSLMRCVRDCQHSMFLHVEAEAADQELLDYLNIRHYPTIQFWREGRLLWEHVGAQEGKEDLGAGLLYFGDEARGCNASEFVQEIGDEEELNEFLNKKDGRLAIVDVSAESSEACIHIFPAIFTLARSMANDARFARLMCDRDGETRKAARSLDVRQVPTFYFYKDGEHLGTFVGSARGEVVGKVMEAMGAIPNRGLNPGDSAPRRLAL